MQQRAENRRRQRETPEDRGAGGKCLGGEPVAAGHQSRCFVQAGGFDGGGDERLDVLAQTLVVTAPGGHVRTAVGIAPDERARNDVFDACPVVVTHGSHRVGTRHFTIDRFRLAASADRHR